MEGSLPRETVPADTLSLESAHEANVRVENRHPGEGSEDCNEGCEVPEDLLRSGRDSHVGEAADRRAEAQGDVGSVPSVSAHEEARRLSFGGESVEGPRSDVKIRVGGRENEEEDGAVDDIGQDLDVGTLDRQDEGRSCRTGRLLGRSDEVGVIGLDD